MFIKVTRQHAINALLRGEWVWFGPAAHPELSCGYQLDTRKPRSRRAAASWPTHFYWQAPRGTRWAWFIRAEGA